MHFYEKMMIFSCLVRHTGKCCFARGVSSPLTGALLPECQTEQTNTRSSGSVVAYNARRGVTRKVSFRTRFGISIAPSDPHIHAAQCHEKLFVFHIFTKRNARRWDTCKNILMRTFSSLTAETTGFRFWIKL